MATAYDVANDRRGWILSVISAIACVFGASIICVDIFVRLIPGMGAFRIEDSRAFLSASMSLSFGVMIFSSLFSMLPSSKRYLLEGGSTTQMAGILMMLAFTLGFIGMQVATRIIHRFMPSHVVDCAHSHGTDPESSAMAHGHGHVHVHAHPHAHAHAHAHHGPAHDPHPRLDRLPDGLLDDSRPALASRPPSLRLPPGTTRATESTPLLVAERTPPAYSDIAAVSSTGQSDDGQDPLPRTLTAKHSLTNLHRPSMLEVRNRVLSFVKDVKPNCDEAGPCYGYTDPCGRECQRAVHPPHHAWDASHAVHVHGANNGGGGSCGGAHNPQDHEELQEGDPETACPTVGGGESSTNVSNDDASDETSKMPLRHTERRVEPHGAHDDGHGHAHAPGHQGHPHHGAGNAAAAAVTDDDDDDDDDEEDDTDDDNEQAGPQHHHHVPANAFLTIGLQTIIAIGLHKFPEGFITFATNHANAALGFNVFLALFVHNIAEGFAMALPLYMALGSRLRAIAYASALGGLSQPLGAAAAAIWLHRLGRPDGTDGGVDADNNGTTYGLLFAATAGLMAAVSLQLFAESLTLHHNRNLTTTFAFLGMLLLGVSNAIGAH